MKTLQRLVIVMIFTVLFLTLQTGSVLALETHAAGVTHVVDNGAVDCPNAGYSRIGDALAAAAPGDTVSICYGIYAEQLVISSKPGLKLIGKGMPVIRAAPVTDGTLILVENSTNVTVQGLMIDGSRRFSMASTEMTGLSFRNSSGTISNNIVAGIRRPDLAPSSLPQGVGIRVYDRDLTADTPAPVKILNNIVYDVQYAGIWVENPIPLDPNSHFAGNYVPTISGNRINTRAISNGVDYTSGIRLDWPVGVSISKNMVMASSGVLGLDTLGFGIYLFNPSQVKVTGNTVKGFTLAGVYGEAQGSYVIGANVISNNTVVDGQLYGIHLGGMTLGPLIQNNVIQKNKIMMKTSPGGDGVSLKAMAYDERIFGNKISGNTIEGYDDPIMVNPGNGISVSGNKVSPLIKPGT
jgi:parallel beta-helix repeat protein